MKMPIDKEWYEKRAAAENGGGNTMTPEIDTRPLTDAQWAVMFSGPEWDQETIEALSVSLPKAYEIHSKRPEWNPLQSTTKRGEAP